jgi:hypothetical protein
MAEAPDTLSQEAVRYDFTNLTAQHLGDCSRATELWYGSRGAFVV